MPAGEKCVTRSDSRPPGRGDALSLSLSVVLVLFVRSFISRPDETGAAWKNKASTFYLWTRASNGARKESAGFRSAGDERRQHSPRSPTRAINRLNRCKSIGFARGPPPPDGPGDKSGRRAPGGAGLLPWLDGAPSRWA